MKPVITVLIWMLIGSLILIQRNELGELLINGHISLAVACAASFTMAIVTMFNELFDVQVTAK